MIMPIMAILGETTSVFQLWSKGITNVKYEGEDGFEIELQVWMTLKMPVVMLCYLMKSVVMVHQQQ